VQTSTKSSADEAADQARAVARLQGQLAAAHDRANKADEEVARLRMQLQQAGNELAAKTANLESKVAVLTLQ
jgi:chromosome segregation ATPase